MGIVQCNFVHIQYKTSQYQNLSNIIKTQLRMPLKCQKCHQEPKCPFWCLTCVQICCINCYSDHASHQSKIQFVCQECQEAPHQMQTVFCESCQQHLCPSCSEKIHNKGKRAKHVLHQTSFGTLKIRKMYIATEDVLGYYGYINFEAFLMDLEDQVPPNEGFLLMAQRVKDTSQIKTKMPTIIHFGSDVQFNEELCENFQAHYPCLQEIILIETHKSSKIYGRLKQIKSIKVILHKISHVIQKSLCNDMMNISLSGISLPNSNMTKKANQSAHYPREFRKYLSKNISTSTSDPKNNLKQQKTYQDTHGKDNSINDIEQLLQSKLTLKGQHNRMYSNYIRQRTQHYRLYSNMSKN